MSKSNSLTDFLTSLADKFRLVLEKSEKINPQDFEEKVTEVYNKGYEQGISEGGGGDNWYDTFWDAFQLNGTRTSYMNEFMGNHWNDDNFRPKYDIEIVGSGAAFCMNTEFSQFKKGRNGEDTLQLDTSKMTGAYNFFKGNTKIKELPQIDLSLCTIGEYIFADCTSLQTISVIVSAQSLFNNMFANCPSLVDLDVSGVIGKSSTNLKSAHNLSLASITKVVLAFSISSTGLSITFSKEAVDKAFETSPGANDGSYSRNWESVKGTRQNLNIVLI